MANIDLGNVPGMKQAPATVGQLPNPAKPSGIPPYGTGGLPSNWHTVVLWFLGAIAMLALADPAPGIATALLIVIIISVLLQNWDVYKTYLGLK